MLHEIPKRVAASEQAKREKKEKKEKKAAKTKKTKKDRETADRRAASADKNDEKDEKDEIDDGTELSDKELSVVHCKLQSILGDVAEHRERRNTYLNLAWTGPVDNTSLQTSIPYEKVANMALDMFVDTTAGAASAPAGGDAASSDEEAVDQPKRTALDVHAPTPGGKNNWKILDLVEKGLEIPIYVTDVQSTPAVGSFKRLGMDVVVNAVWLAYLGGFGAGLWSFISARVSDS